MSWQARAVTVIERAMLKRRPGPDDTIAKIRARFEREARRTPTLPKGWRREDVPDGPLHGEWMLPDAVSAVDDPVILFLHGGGYIFCTVATHRPLVAALAVRAGMRALSLDYRRAPEHAFPAAVNDALVAYRALLDSGIPAGRICLAGDSAGGGLALATALLAREQGMALPAALWLISPWVDLAATGSSIRENSRRDAMFFGESIGPSAQHYLQGTPATHPLASPLYADLTGMPPLCIHASDSEVLRDDAVRLAERAADAGVAVSLRIWHAMPHDWQLFPGFIPEADESLSSAATFLREHVESGGVVSVAERQSLPILKVENG